MDGGWAGSEEVGKIMEDEERCLFTKTMMMTIRMRAKNV